jgi:flagellar hook-associated protein 1 FlgK
MAIWPTLDTARRALLAHEAALGVIGHNIANVNTPGYTRQEAELRADPTIEAGGVRIGSGVHVRTVRQVIDPLLQRRRLGAESAKGEETALRDQLAALSGVANDLAGPSLTDAVNEFFAAADALARNPAGLAERETFLGRATALARELNRRSGAIAGLQRAVDEQVVGLAREANDDVARIADLNRAIVAAELEGHAANDLRDQRLAAINDLARKIAITTVEEPDGSVTVSATGGPALVTASVVVSGIATQPAGVGLDGLPLHQVGLDGPGGGFVAVPQAFDEGEIAGLVQARDGELVTASANLDTLATALRDAVNAIQTDPAARDLDGLGTTAAPIFAGTGAANLSVALTDPRRIAAALSTAPGDNQNALRLADLRTTPQAALGNLTFAGYVGGELARIGEAAAQAKDVAAASELLATQLEEQHLAISGVNLNEELTSLLKFQHAFQAAAQLVNVSNQVLDELLNLI